MKDIDELERPVMHACGHDMHIAVLLATAKLLFDAKSELSGKLIVLFQPNEERNDGAKAMVDNEVYKNDIPIPDVILGQHVVFLPSGVVAIRSGPALSAADSFNVTIYGKGGHVGTPQHCIDPILLTSHIFVRHQSIISQEVAPTDAAVITCASMHSGSAGNIIPDQVDFKLNVRTYDLAVRTRVLKSIKRTIEEEAEAAGVDKLLLIQQYEQIPMTVNCPNTTEILTASFKNFFGAEAWEMDLDTATEGFDNLASFHNIPYVYWNFGGTPAWRLIHRQRPVSATSWILLRSHSPLWSDFQ